MWAMGAWQHWNGGNFIKILGNFKYIKICNKHIFKRNKSSVRNEQSISKCKTASPSFLYFEKIIFSQAALRKLSPQGHKYWFNILVFDNHSIYLVAALYCGLLMPLSVVKLVSLSPLWWIWLFNILDTHALSEGYPP